jgi:pyruvate/2-oxoglutarate dehydrogenase complex dihydrolipoamide acyltransferase (E2) component
MDKSSTDTSLIDVNVPVLPETVMSAKIAKLHVILGEEVKAKQILCEIETDKLVLEIVSPSDGLIDSIDISVGSEISSEQAMMKLQPLELAAKPGDSKRSETGSMHLGRNENSLNRSLLKSSEEKSEAEQNKKLMKFAVYISIVIFTMVFAYFERLENNEHVEEAFKVQLFDIDGITTNLAYYSSSKTSINIKFDSIGLPNRADSYKPEILAYVCAHPILKSDIENRKTIIFNMSAADRIDGNYVNMRIDLERCQTEQ